MIYPDPTFCFNKCTTTYGFGVASCVFIFGGYTGYRYCAVALILGLVWLSMAWGAYKATDDRPWAKKLFAVSVLTIFALNVMMSIDYARPVTQKVRPSYASQAGEVKVPLFRLE